jgi:hypothetical protein
MIHTEERSLTESPFKFIKIALLYAGFYFFSVLLFSRSLADNDLWGYLSFGRIFWEDAYFPFHDVFSYTPTKPVWVYHEWLTGVFFYFIYKWSGPAGLQLLHYVIILLTIWLMYLTALKKGGAPVFASIALIPAMLLISFGYVPVRAQIFTYLFFILTLYILESANKGQRWSVLWWLLPILVLWCNLHGGFVAGLGLIFLYALGEGFSGRKVVPYIKIGIPATLVTLINPYGIQYWVYTLQAITMPRPEIDEWMSIIAALKYHVQDVPVLVFLFLSLLCSVFLIFRRERNLADLLVIAVTIYLGCKSIRHGVLFGLVFGSYLPVVLSEYWEAWRAKRIFFTLPSWVPQSIPVALLLFLYVGINPSLSLTAVPSFALWTPSSHFPVGAINWIKENRVQGNILPHFEWGEFLIWTCYPACRVAMDGRYETVYEEQVYKEYFDFLHGRNKWDIFLRKYAHEIVLIKPNTRTHLLMLKEPSWRVAYVDQGCVLFLNKKLGDFGGS